MKHFKKMMALVIALVMVIGTMSMSGVFAASNPPTPDSKITISSLENGDSVYLYQVLEWDSTGNGWKLTENFKNLNVANITKLLGPTGEAVTLTREDVEAITKYVQDNNISVTARPVSGTDFEATVQPGLYLALVAPSKPGIVYNPIVVSADFNTKNGTNLIDVSDAVMGSSSVAKKKEVTVKKTEPKITNDIGDKYHFKVETTIPLYAESFVDKEFKVFDEVTKYLDIDKNSFVVKVNGTEINTPKPVVADDKHSFTLTFDDAYIKALTDAQDLVITYDAELNITKEQAAQLDNAVVQENKVTITFPNNPADSTSKAVLKDGTRERTFTIDGSLLGHSGWQNSELVKVAADKDGNPILSEISHSNGEKHAALDGAEFGLYTSEQAAEDEVDTLAVYGADGTVTTHGLYHNKYFDTGKVTSKNGGLLYIAGLDAGTYYLKELSAPKGYVRDQNVHEITISVTKKTIQVTEYYTIDENDKVTWYNEPGTGRTAFTYDVEDIDQVTYTIDGTSSTSSIVYSMDLNGPYTSTSTILKSGDAEIANTPGVELPSTGGIGTTIFYVIGAILVLGAGVLLVTRRRMNED